MKNVTVIRFTEGYIDGNGDWIEGSESTHTFQIEDRSFQPGINSRFHIVTETAFQDMDYWTLFLHNDEDVVQGDRIEIDSKRYEVTRILTYPRHREVIVHESAV
ncbi:MAG: hypothetical protein PHF64_11335 [Methanoregula sp.]|nr:hypothetical protein [Methanoregula sp.]